MLSTPAGALAALLAGAVALGTSPLFVRIAETGPTATGFWRMVLALPLVWAFMRLQAPVRLDRRDAAPTFWAGALFAADLFFWQWGVHYTTMASATLLSNFAPLVVTLGAWLLFRDRVAPAFMVALATALGGAVLLMGANASGGERYLQGDLMGLASALFYGGFMLVVARLRGRLDAAALTFWYSLWCAALLLPVALASGDQMLPETWRGWACLLGLAWLSHALGQGLIAHGFGRLPPAFSSLVVLVQPLVAAILAWVLLGEAQGPWQIAGGLLIMAGIGLAVVTRR